MPALAELFNRSKESPLGLHRMTSQAKYRIFSRQTGIEEWNSSNRDPITEPIPVRPNMEDRIKETALEEVEKIKGLTTEAVKSRAYLYPIKVCLSIEFDVLQLKWYPGHILLHIPSKSLETLLVKSYADHHHWHKRHYFHVSRHVSSSSRSPCSGEWTSCCGLCCPSGLEREFHHHQPVGEELLHWRCFGGYF